MAMKPKTEELYMDILRTICEGKTVEEAAEVQFVCRWTAEKGLQQLRTKYKASSTFHLIAILFRKGMIN